MDELYKISRERLTEIADRVRVMAGMTRKMTPAEIVEWLCKVKFTPIGWANSVFTVDFAPSTATGRLPVVVKGTANSEFTLDFTSSAAGELQEDL